MVRSIPAVSLPSSQILVLPCSAEARRLEEWGYERVSVEFVAQFGESKSDIVVGEIRASVSHPHLPVGLEVQGGSEFSGRSHRRRRHFPCL